MGSVTLKLLAKAYEEAKQEDSRVLKKLELLRKDYVLKLARQRRSELEKILAKLEKKSEAMTKNQTETTIQKWQTKQVREAYERFRSSLSSITHRKISFMKQMSNQDSQAKISRIKKGLGSK
jgi:hypothetical protein